MVRYVEHEGVTWMTERKHQSLWSQVCRYFRLSRLLTSFTFPIKLGFGPFRQHVVNASWEVVKELQLPGTVLVKIEVPVVYGKADEVTSRIWKTYNPKVCITEPFNFSPNKLLNSW